MAADDFQVWWDTSRSSYDGETTPAAPTQNGVLGNPNMPSDWNQALQLGEEDDLKQINGGGTSSTVRSMNQSWGFRVVEESQQQLGYSSYPYSSQWPTNHDSQTPLRNDACSGSFFPALDTHEILSDEKLKIMPETTKTTNKRARVRVETASPLPPAFKVRKEKMGDRITALQQLVSPFGKTDTASVLSEAIVYIKFLHDQLGALSYPYKKNGVHVQKYYEKSEVEGSDGEVLASRGLCLVPVSSTFPVTHETTVDFWTPTFGLPTFR